MKKIIITGASGFLGRNLIKRLEREEGMEILALSGCPESPALKGRNVKTAGRDLICMLEAKEEFYGACVINCAFPRNTDGVTRAEGMAYLKDLFLCCEKNAAAAVINISSQSVYSPVRTSPAKETDPVSLDTIYAAEKAAAELMAECIFERSGIPYTNIRLASLIGPGFDVRFVNKMVKNALLTGTIPVRDDGSLFGFLDVADACNGLALMAGSEHYKKWKKVYNLGIKGEYTVTQIAETVKTVLRETDGLETEIILQPTAADQEPGKKPVNNSSLDAALFCQDFSFAPALTMADSIRRIREAL